MKDAFLPNRSVSPSIMQVLALGWAGAFLLLWIFSPFEVLPRPGEVLSALSRMWTDEGLSRELFSSLRLNLEALAVSTIICLGLSYSTVLPFMRPLVAALSKGRFLSLVGFSIIFMLIWGGGHPLKLALLVFGMSVFYLTSMASVISAIPKGEFDHARTLRMGEWRVVWEVVILGTLDKAFEVMRQNAAIGWMMLTMVEGIARQEGGIGVMLIDMNKHFNLPSVFAIQLVFVAVGLLLDYLIGLVRVMVCPYADLTLERR